MVEISVVIITYKRPLEVLERAIKSVLNQSFKNIELLVVNDASEEKELSIEIAKMIGCLNDSRVRYLTYDKNRGSNYARNFGLKNSVGRYIAYLDDDDEWLPIKLEKQFETIVKNPDIALVACGFNILNERGKCGEKKVSIDNSLGHLLQSNFIGGTSFPLLNRRFVVNEGGFDESMTSCQEYDLWIRLRLKHVFGCVDMPLGNYYVSSDSVYRKNHEKFYNGDKKILAKYCEVFQNDKKNWNIHLNNMAFYFLTQKDFKRYFEYKASAFRVKVFSLANITPLYKIFNRSR